MVLKVLFLGGCFRGSGDSGEVVGVAVVMRMMMTMMTRMRMRGWEEGKSNNTLGGLLR